MKYISLILLLSASYCYSDKMEANYGGMKQIKIQFVNMTIITPIKIDCDKFDVYFERKDSINLTSKLDMGDFIRQLNKLKSEAIIFDGEIDARGKIYLHYNASNVKVFCIGYYLTEINGVVYKNTIEFQEYIEKILLK